MQEQSKRQVSEMLGREGEMNDFGSTQKHQIHTELCQNVLKAIFDIADEAYQHQ